MKKATKVSIRVILGLAVFSLFCWVVFILDWQFGETGQAPWVANGVTACAVLSIFPVTLLAIVVTAKITHRWSDLLETFGIWVEHQRHVGDAENRGERPA